jgi:hypothetical protein
MRAKTIWMMALSLCAVLALAVAASADTLTLKDGRVIQGKYIGGTADAIQMDVNGTVQTYDVRDVRSLTRDSNSLPDAPSPQALPPQTPAPPPGVTVPEGTRILVRMIDGIDSERNHVGDHFRASLETNLEQDGVILARRGTNVYGEIANVRGAGRLSGHAELRLELTGIMIHDSLVPIVTGEYDLAGKGRGGNTAKKAAGGAALGAIIGALAGGGKGAAIGAGVGAGAGATVNIITKGEKLRIPSETLLEFRLDAPVTFTPDSEAPR